MKGRTVMIFVIPLLAILEIDDKKIDGKMLL